MNTNNIFSCWFKIAAILIGVIGVILCFVGFTRYHDIPYALHADYRNSKILSNKINDITNDVILLARFKNEDTIKSGTLINTDDLNARIDQLQKNKNYDIERIITDYEDLMEFHNKRNNTTEIQRLTSEREDKLAKVKADADKKTAAVKDTLITEMLEQYNDVKNRLTNQPGLYYTIVANGTVTGQAPDFYNALPYYDKTDIGKDGIVYVGFDSNVFSQQILDYNQRRANGLTGVYYLTAGLILLFLALLWLMVTAGRSPNSSKLTFRFFDKIYLDIAFCLLVAIALPCCTLAVWFFFSPLNAPFFPVSSVLLLQIAYLAIALYAVMFAKRLKSHELLQHTLLYKVSRSFYRACKCFIDAGPFSRKFLIILLLYTVLLGINLSVLILTVDIFGAILGLLVTFVVFVLSTTAYIHLITKRLTGFQTLVEGIKKIKNGNLSHQIPPCGSSVIDNIAADINNITDGLKAAVENEMKAEHLKVELITNVSHDLKTPLTSIITYSDLLSQDTVSPEQKNEYLTILKGKAKQLKQLIDDLFEVSKAQSGTTPINLDKICLNDLITQSLAEFEDGLKKAQLAVSLHVPQEKIIVLADGSKMWRVLSNILNNTIKYGLPKTRVYFDVEVVENAAHITVKNIANYMMNFKAEEIVTRFKRGDESRSGEGSGLGLAIVKSFMDLQKGQFEIVVDGDLFKVTLVVPLA